MARTVEITCDFCQMRIPNGGHHITCSTGFQDTDSLDLCDSCKAEVLDQRLRKPRLRSAEATSGDPASMER
jgi:hypothetical protein